MLNVKTVVGGVNVLKTIFVDPDEYLNQDLNELNINHHRRTQCHLQIEEGHSDLAKVPGVAEAVLAAVPAPVNVNLKQKTA